MHRERPARHDPQRGQAHRDPRRARSSLLSMIPTTTSAGRGLAESLGPLGERVSCLAVRVPTATVSLVELVLEVGSDLPDSEALRDLYREASERSDLAGRLGCSEEPLVSIDFRGDSRSSIVDLPLVERCGPRLMRAIAWYDNEAGYSAQVVRLVTQMAGVQHVTYPQVG